MHFARVFFLFFGFFNSSFEVCETWSNYVFAFSFLFFFFFSPMCTFGNILYSNVKWELSWQNIRYNVYILGASFCANFSHCPSPSWRSISSIMCTKVTEDEFMCKILQKFLSLSLTNTILEHSTFKKSETQSLKRSKKESLNHQFQYGRYNNLTFESITSKLGNIFSYDRAIQQSILTISKSYPTTYSIWTG